MYGRRRKDIGEGRGKKFALAVPVGFEQLLSISSRPGSAFYVRGRAPPQAKNYLMRPNIAESIPLV